MITQLAPLAPNLEATTELADSSPLLRDPDALRARFASDGCLLLRGLLPTAPIVAARNALLDLAREAGWVDPNSSNDCARASDRPAPDYRNEYLPVYHRMIRQPAFERSAEIPALVAAVALLCQGPVLIHRRRIARVIFPRAERDTTQPHQDWFYIRGAPETITAWMPTGDVPRSLGGLAVVPGSHRLGSLEHVPTTGAGGQGIPPERITGSWAGTDYKLGDVLLMHGLLIHGGLPNRSPDRLRISFDHRFQTNGSAIDPSSLVRHYQTPGTTEDSL
ncbi:MAG: phytanoyl-CoA dioxygenase family protein [Planctomycetota bacterium]